MASTINASTSSGLVATADTSGVLQLQTGGTAAVTVNASQNVGIGTASPVSALTLTNAKGLSWLNASGNFSVTAGSQIVKGADNNLYFDSYDGSAVFRGASFAEQMRLDSSGNLLINLTGSQASSTSKLRVAASGQIAGDFKNAGLNTVPVLTVWNESTSGDNLFQTFYTEAGGTARGSITYNRAGGLVAYNTTSDYRAKDILGPVQNSGATIDALKVYEGQMKGATQSRPMLVAHEAQAVTPYAVTGEKDAVKEDGTPDYQQMDVSSLVPLLIAEIQSLRVRIAQLEAK
jgi:hypothetical protein